MSDIISKEEMNKRLLNFKFLYQYTWDSFKSFAKLDEGDCHVRQLIESRFVLALQWLGALLALVFYFVAVGLFYILWIPAVILALPVIMWLKVRRYHRVLSEEYDKGFDERQIRILNISHDQEVVAKLPRR